MGVEPILAAKDVSLQVPIFQPSDRKLMTNPLRFITDLYLGQTGRKVVKLLDRVTMDVNPGDRIGVVGSNGAGKSTLLRLLAGIYAPTFGQMKRRGRAKGLFDISLGMSPEATGLENIYLRGLQMGMSLDEVRNIIPEVIAFSELGDAIEKPLNTYSTGMRLRLAVSVSTMIKPDVLLLDEWIGAGDAHFRVKLKERMNRIIEDTSAVVLATHNVSLMKELCTRGIFLHEGRILFQGDLDETLDAYQAKAG